MQLDGGQLKQKFFVWMVQASLFRARVGLYKPILTNSCVCLICKRNLYSYMCIIYYILSEPPSLSQQCHFHCHLRLFCQILFANIQTKTHVIYIKVLANVQCEGIHFNLGTWCSIIALYIRL